MSLAVGINQLRIFAILAIGCLRPGYARFAHDIAFPLAITAMLGALWFQWLRLESDPVRTGKVNPRR